MGGHSDEAPLLHDVRKANRSFLPISLIIYNHSIGRKEYNSEDNNILMDVRFKGWDSIVRSITCYKLGLELNLNYRPMKNE
jgi:hypothetical protein